MQGGLVEQSKQKFRRVNVSGARMFEGAIAAFVNRVLGKYVEDLDTQQLNFGIFSGDTCLTDLKLKPEALYQLGLPIRVEIGVIGKIVLKIPWSTLFSQPIVLCIEDIYIVAVPSMYGPYDSEIQKRLCRAGKKKVLEELDDDDISKFGLPTDIFDGLMTSVIRNFQITINNVHIRYEERLSDKLLCACGICIQSISMTTTNNKWKPGVCTTNSQTTYQLVRTESLSVYLDHDAEPCLLDPPVNWDIPNCLSWKSTMQRSLQTFGMRNKEFQFLLKPFTAKIKVIVHKGNEIQSSRMLVDIVLQDVAMQLSEMQYVTFCQLYDSLLRGVVNRPHRKFRPDDILKGNVSSWWKYAYHSVLESNVRPYKWENVLKHRKNYRKYKDTYTEILLRPNDTELKLDLQKYEDDLTIVNIVIAREHATQELMNKEYKLTLNTKDCLTRQDSQETVLQSHDNLHEANGEKDNKKTNNRTIDNGTGAKIKLEKLPQPIDYKYNFTLANLSLSLLNKDKEVLVITVTQFLTSIEAQPSILAFKISARAESFVVEGISQEGDLIPMITVDSVLTGNVSSNFLSIDFEKSAVNADTNFDVSVKLEAIEITYHHYVILEMIRFFKLNEEYAQDAILWMYGMCDIVRTKFFHLVSDIVSQTLRINVKMDIKAPYIIFPEHGSMQKGGHILVLDFGNISLSNELQATSLQLEDATLMEMEELLYDRVHILLNGGQILFCHSGDDWRITRKKKDSEFHFLPKIHANATLSYSIKPEYRQLPKAKLNISVSTVKFNLSETKLQLVMHFLSTLLKLHQYDIIKFKRHLDDSLAKKKQYALIASVKELLRIRSNVSLPPMTIVRASFNDVTKELLTNNTSKLDRNVVSSEVSEEDLELLSKTIHLTGFDDIVSPCNHVNLLVRFAIGELSLHLGCTTYGREQPYLNLRLHTLYLEAAIMEYGPAIQFGIGSLLLVDKTNAGVTGSYLELLSTGESNEVFVMSYRKVRSNCPDFKSHFKNIERSLVLNLLNLNIVFHRSAFFKAKDYWNAVKQIFCAYTVVTFAENITRTVVKWKEEANDPPIPPGAIKLSYSARLGALSLRFCDKDSDLMELKIQGFENDCIYNANERMVLRAHLTSLLIEDLNEDTLYAKILSTDEDKVFDLKYVRHTPRLYVCSDIDRKQDDVMSDGTFKLSFGRLNCLLIAKILQDFQHFVTPFASLLYWRFSKFLSNTFARGFEEIKRCATKLHIFIDVQGPTFLLPQRKDVPTLLVFDTGLLSVENFFKRMEQSSQFAKISSNDGGPFIMDNILLKLKSVTVSRAIITLRGDLEVQEPIIEPIHVNFDVKRKTEFRSMMEFKTYGLCNVHGSIDFVNINLSQRDFKSIILVWKDNVSRIIRPHKISDNEYTTAEYNANNTAEHQNGNLEKLEVFLAHNETSNCEINVKLILEGLQLNLFFDAEEVLSSPVRDLNHGLCKLSFGELINTYDCYSDKSLKMKLSLQSCVLQDTRKKSVIVKKIIQSPAKLIGMNDESYISVSMSPIVDMTYTQTPGGEKCFDILIQEIRINLSVPFLMHLGRYFMDALPTDQIDEGIINHGYESINQTTSGNAASGTTSLSHAQYLQDQPDISISVRIQKPEILLFGDLTASNAHVILLQAEVTIESSTHNCTSTIVCTFTDIRAKSRSHRPYFHDSPHWLLSPCDVEICKKEDFAERAVEVVIAVNSMNIHLSAEIIHTFEDIINEATGFLRSINLRADDKNDTHDLNVYSDLWTPKKVLNIPYKELNGRNPVLYHESNEQVVTFHLKPVLLRILIEMDSTIEKLPIMRMESVVSATVTDWFNNFQLESNVNVYAFCYNTNHKSWEPLIELCTKDNVNYKPWEISVKMCYAEGIMINPNWMEPCQHVKNDGMRNKGMNLENSESTDMVFIGPDRAHSSKTCETNLYSEYEDSDTDEEETPRKLLRNFHCLFNANSSTDDESDSDDSSVNEDEVSECTQEYNTHEEHPNLQEVTKPCHPTLYVIMYAEDMIKFTITPNTIIVLNTFLDAFVQAKNGIPIVPVATGKLTLQNNIGHESRIELLESEEYLSGKGARLIASQEYHNADSPASNPSSPEPEGQSNPSSPQWFGSEADITEPDDRSQAYATDGAHDIFFDDSPVSIYKAITGEMLHIVFRGFEDILIYCPVKQDCTLIPLRPIRHEVRYHLVIEVAIDTYLHRTISVRSPLQFRNETSYALGLYYKKQSVEKLQLDYIGQAINPFDDNIRMTIIEPDCTYSIPLYIAYHFPIHVLPAYLEKYQVSDEGIYWKELTNATNAIKDVYCKMKDDDGQAVFAVKALGTELPLSARPGCHVPNYLISILPPITFNNQLPFVIDINVPCICYDVRIEPGEKINVHSLRWTNDIPFVFKIHNYLGAQWAGSVKLNPNVERKTVLMSAENDTESAKSFMLCVDLYKGRSWTMVIQAQYWIINKSGLPLFIQECHSHIVYEMPEDELMIFSRKCNKKDMVRVRAHQSEWSMPFGLDGISSNSLIVCRDLERGRKYRILTETESSRLSPLFTSILMFLPYFLINNKTKRSMRFMEENDDADLWNDLLPGQEVSFWPVTESMRMRVKWKSSQLVSQHFDITYVGRTVLRMDNGTALCVDITGGSSSPYCVTFQKYTAGDTPVRIDNLCDELFLKIHQVNLGQVTLLNPFQSLLYTWDDPTQPRELMWNIYNNKNVGYRAQFDTDGFGHELVSFVTIERQTDDSLSVSKPSVDARHCATGKIETSHGVDDAEEQPSSLEQIRKDEMIVYWVSYMEGEQRVLLFTQRENVFLKAKTIIDAEPSKREIFLSLAGIELSIVSKTNGITHEFVHANILDSASHWELFFGKRWKSLSLELSAWIESIYASSSKKGQLSNFIEVDLDKMHITKPFFGKLRRTYSPGMWLYYRCSDAFTHFQGHVHRIQVDNQLHEASFPVVLHSSLEKSFVNYAGCHKLQHCIEFVCLKQRKLKHNVYKGISVIVRELNCNLQEEFLLHLIDLIPKRAETKHSIAAKLRRDVSNIHVPLFRRDNNSQNGRGKNVIEHMYISPIVIHLKLLAKSERSAFSHSATLNEYHNMVKFVFQYAQNGALAKQADFKLPYCQQNSIIVNSAQILCNLLRNYTVQLIQQFHVLIRSTTVLGNQYGYNFKEPGERYYDPNSLVMCCDETAEKLCYDVACYLGYATVDALQTAIINFETREPHNLYAKAYDLYENIDVPPSILINDNALLTEIELELSALIASSINGVHQEESNNFFKTLWKKVSTLFRMESSHLRSSPGVIADIIKRSQEIGHKFMNRVRLPRYINPFMGVELLSLHKGKGMHLLNITSKGHCAQTDTYWAHAVLSNDGKSIALLSLQRIYFIEKGNDWGVWDVKWTIETNQLLTPPAVINNKLVLHVNKNEEITSPVVDWYLESRNSDVLDWLCRKINTAMVLNMESSVCSKQQDA